MEELKTLLGDIRVSEVIFFFIAATYAIKFIFSGYQKVTYFHDELQRREEILSSMDSMRRDIDDIKRGLETITRESRDYRKTSLHDKIAQSYFQFRSQGYITKSQLENFQLCLLKYYEVGGNGLVKNKIEAEILNLDVREG